MSLTTSRRFSGIIRLYGNTAAQRLEAAHVCVVGIGGVGSWAVEALARSGIGKLTLIDLDMVAESNTNRQIHALSDQYGKAKVDVMSDRIANINPDCWVKGIEDFVTPENVRDLLSERYSVVVDAIDQTKAKAALIAFCHSAAIPIIVTGAAGGQIDPTQIKISDLSRTIQDPLLARVRSLLRREYGFPRNTKKQFGIRSVFSTEQLSYPANIESCDATPIASGLNCAGFGSSICVTATFGMAAAGESIQQILRTQTKSW